MCRIGHLPIPYVDFVYVLRSRMFVEGPVYAAHAVDEDVALLGFLSG